jgi:hypothetical protein
MFTILRFGGAVFISKLCSCFVKNTTFDSCSCNSSDSSGGGAIYTFDSDDFLLITNCTFSYVSSNIGGALYFKGGFFFFLFCHYF